MSLFDVQEFVNEQYEILNELSLSRSIKKLKEKYNGDLSKATDKEISELKRHQEDLRIKSEYRAFTAPVVKKFDTDEAEDAYLNAREARHRRTMDIIGLGNKNSKSNQQAKDLRQENERRIMERMEKEQEAKKQEEEKKISEKKRIEKEQEALVPVFTKKRETNIPKQVPQKEQPTFINLKPKGNSGVGGASEKKSSPSTSSTSDKQPSWLSRNKYKVGIGAAGLAGAGLAFKKRHAIKNKLSNLWNRIRGRKQSNY